MPLSGAGSLKQALREEYKVRRRAIAGEERLAAQARILRSVEQLNAFKSCDALFTYISTADETDTREIIGCALKNGKRVAVPVCFGGGEMSFYFINSLAETHQGRFGIFEPTPSESTLAVPAENSLCLVPALAFDREGFRLGMGGGYYDRFLARHRCVSAGLCFERLVCEKLPRESFDKNVLYLITDERIIINGEGTAEGGHTYE